MPAKFVNPFIGIWDEENGPVDEPSEDFVFSIFSIHHDHFIVFDMKPVLNCNFIIQDRIFKHLNGSADVFPLPGFMLHNKILIPRRGVEQNKIRTKSE